MRPLFALVTAAALLSACQCGVSFVDGGVPEDGGSGGGNDAGSACPGGCPAGKVCDAQLGRCIGGCPVGQGTCATGCCPWDSFDASVPAAMSGRRPVLLLDAESRAFIVHRGYNATDRLHLSTQTDAGTFVHVSVAYDGNIDWQNDALDEPDGGRWIAFSQFYPNNTKDVTLLHLAGGDYSFDTLAGADFGTPASLQLHDGRLFVLWKRFTDGDVLALSERLPGDAGFVTRTIPVPILPSWTAELRIDSTGVLHIAYGTAGMTGGVFYGREQSDGGVAFEQVDSELSTSRVVLELDSTGAPHLVYFQLSDHLLHWARRTSSGWQRETVTYAAGEGWNPALALDATGRPHVTYQGRDGGSAHYALRVGPNAWDTQTIDPGPFVGAESDLALTSSGRPCVAYTVTTMTYYGLRYGCLPAQ